MNTIATLIGAIVSLAESWLPNNNLVNDIKDAVLALLGIKTLTGAPIVGVALSIATKAEAGLVNLENGQAATVASDTVDGKTYSLVLVENGSAAAAAIGL